MTDGSNNAHSAVGWTPPMVKPGPEMEALSRFHADRATWTGTVQAGGMGPGSPEMDARGRATCERIIDGLWLSCLFEQDQFVAGEKVLTWKAQWIVGWDASASEYRAVGADSNGRAFIFHGGIRDDRLIMESLGEGPVKLRFIWDAADPMAVTWRNEISSGGGAWSLIEEYVITPAE